MTLKTYLKYKAIFEERYVLGYKDLGWTYIHPLLKDFRNKALFLFIYSYDNRNIHISNIVYSIDKNPRYKTFKKEYGSRILIYGNMSMIDKYPEELEKVCNYFYSLC